MSKNKVKCYIVNDDKIMQNKDIDLNNIEKLYDEKNKVENEIKILQQRLKKIEILINEKSKNKIVNETITKEQIICLFKENIKDKKYIKNNNDHDGSEGHWLEKMMNLSLNSNNMPDIGGYEMKKNSKKISFGDWSATEYLFSSKTKFLDDFNKEKITMTREEFIKYFGNKNEEKDNRYSWSGACVPKYNKWNECGQKLNIDNDNNILAMYSHEKDKREHKNNKKMKEKIICIAMWECQKMEKHVNSKFNKKGFFICKKNKNEEYDKICFGPAIDYKLFIEKIKTGDIFFDSGMYYDIDKPNSRLYSQWRASQKFWNDLITEEF